MNAFFGIEIPANDAPTTFDLIPAGLYKAICVEGNIEEKQHPDGTVREVVFKFQILEGAHANRFIWQRYSVSHPSAKAQEFARSMIGSFAHALSLDSVTSPHELLNKPLGIKVKIDGERTVGGKTYSARNQVNGYCSIEQVDGTVEKPQVAASASAPPASAATSAPPAASAPAPTGKRMPWHAK